MSFIDCVETTAGGGLDRTHKRRMRLHNLRLLFEILKVVLRVALVDPRKPLRYVEQVDFSVVQEMTQESVVSCPAPPAFDSAIEALWRIELLAYLNSAVADASHHWSQKSESPQYHTLNHLVFTLGNYVIITAEGLSEDFVERLFVVS